MCVRGKGGGVLLGGAGMGGECVCIRTSAGEISVKQCPPSPTCGVRAMWHLYSLHTGENLDSLLGPPRTSSIHLFVSGRQSLPIKRHQHPGLSAMPETQHVSSHHLISALTWITHLDNSEEPATQLQPCGRPPLRQTPSSPPSHLNIANLISVFAS